MNTWAMIDPDVSRPLGESPLGCRTVSKYPRSTDLFFASLHNCASVRSVAQYDYRHTATASVQSNPQWYDTRGGMESAAPSPAGYARAW